MLICNKKYIVWLVLSTFELKKRLFLAPFIQLGKQQLYFWELECSKIPCSLNMILHESNNDAFAVMSIILWNWTLSEDA
jgi:hypothetical protein